MKLTKLAAVLGLGLVSAAAQAGFIQAWNFQDDSIDFILRANGTGGFDLVTSGAVQKGDIFVGIFEMQTASATPPGVSLIPPGKELTGVSVIQLATDNPTTNPFWTFQPYSGGMNAILALIGAGAPTVVGGNPGGGAVAAMWLNTGGATYNSGDTNPAVTDRDLVLDAAHPTWGDTTNCTSFVDCLKEASLGDLFQVDGLWGTDTSDRNDPDNRWIAIANLIDFPGGVDYDTVKSGAKSTQFASFSARLSNLFNVVEPVLFQNAISGVHCPGATHANADNCVQVRVTGQILGGDGLNNGAVGRDDIDARKLVQVPEPATLGLLGLGLLGLGLLRRRQA
ncbi:MAG: PEP-CTERM sorting domain-containing protein [Burkholderiales bacterium]|nr:PEP-CTERM sorting domain-containing protein [Burkholderiales bacterium]